MKRLLFLLAIFCTLQANAQPYSISFSGTGLSTVKVENLTTGVIVDVPAGDVLILSTPTGIPEVNNMKKSGLKVYPNPMTDKSTLEIFPPLAGDAIISVCDMTGKIITQFKSYFDNSIQEFSLSGIKNGLHLINVQGNGYQFSEKLLSNGKSNGTAIIARLGNNIQEVAEKKSIKNSKGVQATVDMAYTAGERLKYTAVSVNNKTVMTDIPVENKTVTFTFTECKDGDNNYYPVVQIGTQLWMAENLKTTKYKDGITSIPNVIVNGSWGGLTTHAYCWYSNAEATYKDTYGALYNWHTVITGNLCPSGWHIPSDVEWTSLTDYLGGTSVAGGKLKETGITHWTSSNTGATNETGFTALPGGYRYYLTGTFDEIGISGYWWSSSVVTTNDAWNRFVGYDYSNVNRNGRNKSYGFSVRCLNGVSIGDSYQGGIVAYILQPGDAGYDANVQHGLIAAPSDQSTGIQWYNGSNTTTGATASALGTGNANTNTIVSNQGSGSYAAKLCYDLVLGVYSDWFLPSRGELDKLCINQAAIGGLAAAYYWSSTEIADFAAYGQGFNNCSQYNDYKYVAGRVRAIRAF